MEDGEFVGFVWDADKSERCFQERGFDFDYAVRIFEDGVIEWEDRRRDYGKRRFIAVGTVDKQTLAVVWTLRESLRRIISARPASRAERNKLYGKRDTQQ